VADPGAEPSAPQWTASLLGSAVPRRARSSCVSPRRRGVGERPPWLSVAFFLFPCGVFEPYYSCRTKVRFLSATLQQTSRPDCTELGDKRGTEPPAQRRHGPRRQLRPRTRALPVAWQEELLRFVFVLPSWHHAVQDFFFFLLISRTIGSGPLASRCRTLDQIPSHCFVKTAFNAMTKHRVSY